MSDDLAREETRKDHLAGVIGLVVVVVFGALVWWGMTNDFAEERHRHAREVAEAQLRIMRTERSGHVQTLKEGIVHQEERIERLLTTAAVLRQQLVDAGITPKAAPVGEDP